MNGPRLIVLLCVAEVLSMTGFGTFPALQPTFFDEWGLSNTEAGWINGIYFGAYMLAVPVLVALTDRVDPRRIYAFAAVLTIAASLSFGLLAEGFWSATALRALAGLGLAGTYMPGLKAPASGPACRSSWPASSRPGSTGAGPSFCRASARSWRWPWSGSWCHPARPTI
jgi:MFS family permease